MIWVLGLIVNGFDIQTVMIFFFQNDDDVSKRPYPCARDYIDAVLGVVESLNHGDESRPSIAFLVHARQVVVHLNNTLRGQIKNILWLVKT